MMRKGTGTREITIGVEVTGMTGRQGGIRGLVGMEPVLRIKIGLVGRIVIMIVGEQEVKARGAATTMMVGTSTLKKTSSI